MALQGQTPVTATTELVLRAGDTLDIRSGASVIVRLSDGSELQLGQNTKIDLVELARRPQDKARMTSLKLWWGKIVCFIAPAHQVEGSAFTVETPNAKACVKFSQPVIEASYDPITGISLFKAYTVTLVMTNRKTRKVETAPPESQITIQEDGMVIAPLPAGEVIPAPRSDLQELPAEVLPTTSQAPSAGEGQQAPAKAAPERLDRWGIRPGPPRHQSDMATHFSSAVPRIVAQRLFFDRSLKCVASISRNVG